jgi:hypothetical protein
MVIAKPTVFLQRKVAPQDDASHDQRHIMRSSLQRHHLAQKPMTVSTTVYGIGSVRPFIH